MATLLANVTSLLAVTGSVLSEVATQFPLAAVSADAVISTTISGGGGGGGIAAGPKPLVAELAMTRFVVQRILTPLVVAFGVVGNIVNIAVLTRRWMKSSTNHYLTALAVYDILYLVLGFVMSVRHYDVDPRADNLYNRYQFKLGRPLTDTCSNTGVWLTLTFTVERYIGVCHPMRGKVWCTPRRAKYVIAFVCLAAAIITFPEFFEWQIVETINPVTNATRLAPGVTWFGSQKSYSVGYKYTNQILFTFLPLLLLLIFNSLLVRQVMLATARRHKMMAKPHYSQVGLAGPGFGGSSAAASGSGNSVGVTCAERQSRDQQRITVMLISVVVVFLLCQLPQAIVHIYRVVKYELRQQEPTYYEGQVLRITGNVFNLLVMLNCSTNFILYSAFSTKFRSTFSRLFCRCLCCAPHIYTAGAGRDPVSEATVAGRYVSLAAAADAHNSTSYSSGGPRGSNDASGATRQSYPSTPLAACRTVGNGGLLAGGGASATAAAAVQRKRAAEMASGRAAVGQPRRSTTDFTEGDGFIPDRRITHL